MRTGSAIRIVDAFLMRAAQKNFPHCHCMHFKAAQKCSDLAESHRVVTQIAPLREPPAQFDGFRIGAAKMLTAALLARLSSGP